jgi:hypothetical protein
LAAMKCVTRDPVKPEYQPDTSAEAESAAA